MKLKLPVYYILVKKKQTLEIGWLPEIHIYFYKDILPDQSWKFDWPKRKRGKTGKREAKSLSGDEFFFYSNICFCSNRAFFVQIYLSTIKK